ncbi:Fic family protein [Lamprobacter modestohalophilus]|uniref:Fic family protein n=1 Tax=Lamprobacter modestohalophilus TaxID=1064514 RepID=UPI001F5BC570|nr:Fic family protein [Lamprobacter modestohalophilus]
MRRKVHYVIHPAYLWNSIHERARTQDPELLQTLERAFQYIEGGVLNLYYPDRMGNGCRTLRNGCLCVSKWIMLQTLQRPVETASPFEIPQRMTELVGWFEQSQQEGLHPLIAIGLFVVVVLEIHPFQDGNGRLSRVLTTLLLLRARYAYVPLQLAGERHRAKQGALLAGFAPHAGHHPHQRARPDALANLFPQRPATADAPASREAAARRIRARHPPETLCRPGNQCAPGTHQTTEESIPGSSALTIADARRRFADLGSCLVTPAEHRRQLLPTGIIERYTPRAHSAVPAPGERTTAGLPNDG